MANDYYTPSGWPSTNAQASSSPVRSEMETIKKAFDRLPVIAGNNSKTIFVNSSGSAIEAITNTAAKSLLGIVIGVGIQAYEAKLVALAGLVSAAAKIPYFTSATTMAMLDFKDENDMISDSATALSSQASIKSLTDTTIAAYDGVLLAPSSTKALYYQASAPTGWTIDAGLDSRAVVIHATSSGTFGSVRYDIDHVTGNGSASSTHFFNWSGSGTSTSGLSGKYAFLGSDAIMVAHSHTWGRSAASETESVPHTHTQTATLGMYAILCNKT